MKPKTLLILIISVVFTSCAPAIYSAPNTAESTEMVKPTLTANAPVNTATPIKTVTPTEIEKMDSLRAMTLDNAGNLWAITSQDVIRWNLKTGKYTKFKDIDNGGAIIDISSGKDGSIWVITYGRLMKFMDEKWTTINDGKGGTERFEGGGLDVQRDGTLWISLGHTASTVGAYRYDGKKLTTIRSSREFGCGFASILEGNGKLWAIDGICMKSFPIFRVYDNGQWTEIKDYYPSKLVTDAHRNVWFDDEKTGIIRADFSEKINFPIQEYSPGFAFAPDNSLWIIYSESIYQFSHGQWKQIDIEAPRDSITCMVIGQGGSVFIGTDGLGVFRFTDSKWVHYLPNK